MNLTPLHPFGATVRDVALDRLGPEQVTALRAELAEHGVLVLPDQTIGDDGFLAFLRAFGELAFTEGETAVDGFPDLNVVSNVGRATPPRSQWHVDTSYVAVPPAYTALRAVTIPAEGGETLFADQYHAHDTLPPELREALAGRTIRHVVTGLALDAEAETEAEHPVLRPHPLTGRPALYLSSPARCAAVSSFDEVGARALVDYLLTHSTRTDNVLRHPWSPGDVVIWDNGCVLHRADHSAVAGDRVLHRGMIANHGPAAELRPDTE